MERGNGRGRDARERGGEGGRRGKKSKNTPSVNSCLCPWHNSYFPVKCWYMSLTPPLSIPAYVPGTIHISLSNAGTCL